MSSKSGDEAAGPRASTQKHQPASDAQRRAEDSTVETSRWSEAGRESFSEPYEGGPNSYGPTQRQPTDVHTHAVPPADASPAGHGTGAAPPPPRRSSSPGSSGYFKSTLWYTFPPILILLPRALVSE